ncbi:MAG: GNAT family N-acetyltransferase [Chitinophagales bacterium]|jgi:ElaA protein|nr:GNAT family N-acetyltransferase [Chitinophagales bacterium]
MRWVLKKFQELTPDELYALLRLRAEVFVVEQTCAFQDLDNKDQPSYHLLGYLQDELVAYTRLVPPGISYTAASIGRVVTSPAHRKKGFGKLLMQESIKICDQLFGKITIMIGAQCYLIEFYSSLGFVPSGEVYLEDGIEHIEMTLTR